MNSYWGKVQYKTSIMRGVSEVSTSSHGGVIVSSALARKYIPADILNKIPMYGQYFCFEEDCDWSIPYYFIDNALFNKCKLANTSYNEVKDMVINSIKNWHSECMKYPPCF